MIKRGIRLEPFGAELVVATGVKDEAKLCKLLQLEVPVPKVRGWVQALHYHAGGVQIVVVLSEKRCEQTLYHEALHVVCELLQIHGVPQDYEGQEMMCYLQEYVVRKIDEAVYTKPRGQRKRSVSK